MKKYTKKDVTEMLCESNAIENVYSKMALTDAQKAWDFAFANRNKITLEYILEIHRLLGQHLYPKIAGKWRDCDVYIGGHRKIFVSETLIKEDVSAWIKKCEEDISNLSDKKKSNKITNWHLDIEEIHPHQDLNGRTYRLIMNIQRFNAGLPIWIIHEGDEQMGYYRLFDSRY